MGYRNTVVLAVSKEVEVPAFEKFHFASRKQVMRDFTWWCWDGTKWDDGDEIPMWLETIPSEFYHVLRDGESNSDTEESGDLESGFRIGIMFPEGIS